MIRSVLLLLLTLGLFAGAIGWLHHRAGADARPKSPAELALERTVPPMEFYSQGLQRVFDHLSQHANVQIDVPWDIEPYRSNRDKTWRYDLNFEAQTVVQVLDRLCRMYGRSDDPPVYWTNGGAIHMGLASTAPRICRVYDLSKTAADLCKDISQRDLALQPNPEHDAVQHLEIVSWERTRNTLFPGPKDHSLVVGTRIVLCHSAAGHRLLSRHYKLAIAEESSPGVVIADEPGHQSILTRLGLRHQRSFQGDTSRD